MKVTALWVWFLLAIISFAGEVGTVHKEYFDSGELKSTYEILAEEDGKARGVFNYYYKNGKLKIISPIISYGNELGYTSHGIAKTFFENGKLQSVQNYKFGKRNGLSKLYYEDGRLREEAVFEGDVSEVLKRNDPDGKAINKKECLFVSIKSLSQEVDENIRIDNYYDRGIQLGWVLLYRKSKDGWVEEAKRPAANHLGSRDTEYFKFMQLGELRGTFRVGVTCCQIGLKDSSEFVEFYSEVITVEQNAAD